MNYWNIETMTEQKRRQVREDMKRIRLEELAEAQVYRQGWFERLMYGFGDWMVASGKRIRSRYEAPCAQTHHVTTGGLAH